MGRRRSPGFGNGAGAGVAFAVRCYFFLPSILHDIYCIVFCAFWQGQSPCCQGWLSQRAMRRVRIVDAEKLRPAIEAGSTEGFARTSYNKLCAVVKGQAI